MKYHLWHLGCRVNAAEMDALSRSLRGLGWGETTLEEADVAVVNTCTVTKRADSKSLYAIRRAAQHARHVFVTGCFSALEEKAALSIPGVAGIIPQDRKGDAAALILEKIGPVPGNGAAPAEPERPLPSGLEGEMAHAAHARAILKVQDGCAHFCAYCRIPYARGKPVSIPSESLLEEVRRLADAGVQECVLTGINLGYWREGSLAFDGLLERMLDACGDMYLRLSSLEPRSFERGVARHFRHPRLVPHLHFPVQGGSDTLLARMNRHYTTAHYAELLAELRGMRPDLSISTDAICGFPGESEAEFEHSLAFYDACAFSKIHVFPFSPRPLTAAEKLPGQVRPTVVHERTRRMNALAAAGEARYRETLRGVTQRFILETEPAGEWAEGTTDHYQKGRLRLPPGSALRRGESTFVRMGAEAGVFEALS